MSRSREGCRTEEPGGAEGGQVRQGRGSATMSPPPPLTATDTSRAVRYKARQPASQVENAMGKEVGCIMVQLHACEEVHDGMHGEARG